MLNHVSMSHYFYPQWVSKEKYVSVGSTPFEYSTTSDGMHETDFIRIFQGILLNNDHEYEYEDRACETNVSC